MHEGGKQGKEKDCFIYRDACDSYHKTELHTYSYLVWSNSGVTPHKYNLMPENETKLKLKLNKQHRKSLTLATFILNHPSFIVSLQDYLSIQRQRGAAFSCQNLV